MKKILGEFKTFITRGNVVDMAVGVTVGSAFTAIVNGLSNFILKPIINWVIWALLQTFGVEGGLSTVYIYLHKEEVDGEIIKNLLANNEALPTEYIPFGDGRYFDFTQSIYIDCGAFINAILNFMIIAVVLFAIVKIINTVRENAEKFQAYGTSKKQFYIELRAAGVNPRNKAAVAAYLEAKEKAAAEKAAAEAAAAAEKARLDRLENPTTEDLLKDIRELLKDKK